LLVLLSLLGLAPLAYAVPVRVECRAQLSIHRRRHSGLPQSKQGGLHSFFAALVERGLQFKDLQLNLLDFL
jgi:hypothetical protein